MAEPSESRLYKEFVTRSLSEVQRGLKLDSYDPSSKKRKVCFALETQDRKRPNRTAAEKVIDGRFALGGDDASYLASGLATLWSTVGDVRDPNEDELGLAPASLYAPDAVNGVRKGLLAALERRNEELRKEAPRSLPKLLKALQVLLEQIDASSSETPELNDLMGRGTVRTVEERTMLLAFLMRLRELLHPTQDDNLAQLILSKGREQITQLVDRFEKDQAELVAEHERRCKELLAGETLSRAVLTARNVELRRLLGACEDKLRSIEGNRGPSSGAATPPSASSGGGSGPSSEGSSPSGAYGVLNPNLVRDLLATDAVRNAEKVAQSVTDDSGPSDADPQAAKDAVAASLGPSDADPQAAADAVDRFPWHARCSRKRESNPSQPGARVAERVRRSHPLATPLAASLATPFGAGLVFGWFGQRRRWRLGRDGHAGRGRVRGVGPASRCHAECAGVAHQNPRSAGEGLGARG